MANFEVVRSAQNIFTVVNSQHLPDIYPNAGERSYSTLKREKNNLHASMDKERLGECSCRSIESKSVKEITIKIYITDVISR